MREPPVAWGRKSGQLTPIQIQGTIANTATEVEPRYAARHPPSFVAMGTVRALAAVTPMDNISEYSAVTSPTLSGKWWRTMLGARMLPIASPASASVERARKVPASWARVRTIAPAQSVDTPISSVRWTPSVRPARA